MKHINSILPALLLSSSLVSAQTYPTKPVNMVVPFAAGGPTDTLARNLGVAWGKLLKQTVVVENVGGAGGNIGVNRVAKAAPDGYTILLHHIGMSTRRNFLPTSRPTRTNFPMRMQVLARPRICAACFS